ncbi:putative amidophosphoribosyltransferase [Desulfosporosinus orientis DSM 765]|uniref:Putative amidophosphoribosyltransferase n=1 Tax=Desulfosporosinus orientis (strain ATCC 19365 / DSM 765 / NCIMB 8382 / VKM B-1628 / Singapore I) TaxID=768706 RepID=G7WGE5_DESOD|nr:ComF family protein [Desulfosporosinus orientis]AET70877.1 putative amidophosphoribosyltransferase [Desulfosporosinus orientis DSM 765]
MLRLWRETAKFARGLWYDAENNCVFCGDKQGPICLACQTNYLRSELRRCQGCGKLIQEDKLHCLDCSEGKGPAQLDQITAWGHYAGGLKDFIRAIKFNAQPRQIGAISRPLSEWAIRQLPPVDGIVAVPMHPKRLAVRGFNQAEVIASALSWELGMPMLSGVERIEERSSQAQLSRQERLHNLQNAFIVRQGDSLQGRSIWLVDDVVTTGATMEAVAEVLRRSGVKAIYGLCLAAGLEPQGL